MGESHSASGLTLGEHACGVVSMVAVLDISRAGTCVTRRERLRCFAFKGGARFSIEKTAPCSSLGEERHCLELGLAAIHVGLRLGK